MAMYDYTHSREETRDGAALNASLDRSQHVS